MMKRFSYFILGSFAGAAVMAGVVRADRKQILDAVKISPQLYSVRLENKRVRVLDYRLKPGEMEPLHSHLPGVAYVITGAKIRTTSATGEAAEGMLTSGDVHWREKNVTHAVQNSGDTEMRALIVELKDK